jgi:hypothetical protein
MPAQVNIAYTYYRGNAQNLAEDVCTGLVTDMGNDSLTYATIATPVRTGRLRAGNQLIVEAPANWSATARLVNDTDYAWNVHNGTQPHVITPRTPGGVLRFETGGQVVYATHVNHPGTRPQPFLAEGARQAALEHDFIYTDE